MPNSSSPNRPQFFPQEAPNTCAVACLRMVLSAYGVTISQSELAEGAKTNEFGTELGELVLAATGLGFDSEAGSFSLGRWRPEICPIAYFDGMTLSRTFPMHPVVGVA